MVASMPKNADNERIDWHWVMSLDLEHGIGAAKSQGIDLIAVLNAADTTFFVDLGENGSHAGFGTIRPTVA